MDVLDYVLTKTLMDGGSSINILYYETFYRMGLRDEQMVPTITLFLGIVPGKKAYPLGKITLDVVFGTAKNFRLERIVPSIAKKATLFSLSPSSPRSNLSSSS